MCADFDSLHKCHQTKLHILALSSLLRKGVAKLLTLTSLKELAHSLLILFIKILVIATIFKILYYNLYFLFAPAFITAWLLGEKGKKNHIVVQLVEAAMGHCRC